ncbi:ABC transporter substrate-binding protein [Nocardioides sp. CER19]|uniref:ABC transporter substrate-binding protein n=1 Tax=Nocardioides sp. CER19 TaxID=3038538 RepID=UPI002447BFC9|nr:ABC transporter substrate-binding protein [Nocardioides sp. CER19]MDH2415201.1 ABC transporter substrate-binding protein [Nocardioides sp. CER19]
MSVDSSTDVDTIWYTRCPVPTASGIAIDTGILSGTFAPEHVAVTSIRASDDPAVRESHFDHSQERSFREGGNIPPLHARSLGKDTRVVGLTWVEEFQSLLTLPESGIAGPEDLRGRRILVPGHGGERIDFERAMALRGLEATLDVAGLTLDDVEIVDVRTQVGNLVERQGSYEHDHYRFELAALHAGDGEAFYAKGAPALETIARRELLQPVFDLATSPDPRHRVNNGTPRPITVSAELLETRPDLVQRYLAALIDAALWAREHEDRAFEILAAETGASVASARTAYGASAPQRLLPSWDPRLVELLGFQKDFLLRHGFLAGDVDLDAWLVKEPLLAAFADAGIDPTTSPLNGASS